MSKAYAFGYGFGLAFDASPRQVLYQIKNSLQSMDREGLMKAKQQIIEVMQNSESSSAVKSEAQEILRQINREVDQTWGR